MKTEDIVDLVLDSYEVAIAKAVDRKVAELAAEVRQSLVDMRKDISHTETMSLRALSFASTAVATPVPRGAFDMSTAYRGGDVASYNGSTWLCLRSVTGRVPGTNSDWAKVTADKPASKATKK
jgi:hypothetical protein